MVKLKAPTLSGSVGVEGSEVQIENGFVNVEERVADLLVASHGFRRIGVADEGPEKSVVSAEYLAVPRSTLSKIFQDLGIVVTEGMSDEVLVLALSDAASSARTYVQTQVADAENRLIELNVLVPRSEIVKWTKALEIETTSDTTDAQVIKSISKAVSKKG